MTDYNGWTNYETWNVSLWIDNEEPVYRDKVRCLRRGNTHAEDVEQFARDWFPNGTPDFDSASDFDKVNWSEIAKHWEDESGEYHGEQCYHV